MSTPTSETCHYDVKFSEMEDSTYTLREKCIKEVIQPHLPVRLPCYDFTPITSHNFGPHEAGLLLQLAFVV